MNCLSSQIKSLCCLISLFILINLAGCRNLSTDPDVIVITIDTLRKDHLGSYGYPYPTSPFLDRFSQNSLQAINFITTTTYTNPAHASLFTGKYPDQHLTRDNKTPYQAEFPTMAELFKTRGYHTGAFVSGAPLARSLCGLDKGFDNYDDEMTYRRRRQKNPLIAKNQIPPPAKSDVQDTPFQAVANNRRKGEDTIREALDWLNSRSSEQPVFLWIHLYDPHGPYNPPDPLTAIFAETKTSLGYHLGQKVPVHQRIPGKQTLDQYIARYDGEIRYADACLEHFMKELSIKRTRKKQIVITADHGESLGEHNYYFDHGKFVYEPCLAIPMFMTDDNEEIQGKLLSSFASLIDIFPTLTTGLNNGSHDPEGTHLFDLVSRSEYSMGRHLFAESKPCHTQEPGGRIFCVQHNQFKYVYRSDPLDAELFDLATNPSETMDIKDNSDNPAVLLRSQIEKRIDENKSLKPVAPKSLDERELESMRALGYVE